MTAAQYLFNIQGCIQKYADLKSARSWFLKAQRELKGNEFSELIRSVYRWALVEVPNLAVVEELLAMLAEFDGPGDKVRREEVNRTKQEKLAAERREAERQMHEAYLAEQERIARAEREQIRAQLAAKAERERVHREQLQREREERKRAVLAEIDSCLQSNFLTAETYFRTLTNGIVTEAEFEARKLAFVSQWFANRSRGSTAASKVTPDSEQLAAIAAVNGNVQVVARAGSGKTATLVNRSLFLLEHCRVAPESMLILTFNRKAAYEVRRRLLSLIHDGADQEIRSEIDDRARHTAGKGQHIDWGALEANAVDAVVERLKVSLPHVMTFHALAYAIVHPEESILHNDADGEAQGLSRVFQRVIDDHLQFPGTKNKVRELMLAHFREDWDRIVGGRYDQPKEELLRFRRSLPRESLGGEYVKSYGEKLIADFLFEHDIAYKYERNHWWDEVNYRPDFTIFKTPKSGLIIEYFGLSGDPDYDEMSREKRTYWSRKRDWKLIEFSPRDIASGDEEAFKDLLKEALERHNIVCNRLTEDELWHRIRGRAIDRFTNSAVNFVGRCRKQSLSPDDLRQLIDAYEPLSPVETMFLALAHTLYAAYLERLTATGADDFDGLMQRAASAVTSDLTKFHRKSGSGDLTTLRFVFIDEFQDFSDPFYRLLSAIREVSPSVELFCVGDDWQAINGFAGSDLKFFEHFDNYIKQSRRLHVATNYRSSKSIVAVGNALMHGLGKPALACKESLGVVLLSDVSKFRPSLIEKQRHPGDVITPVVSRIANNALAAGSDVVMLTRRNSLPWFVNFKEHASGASKGLHSYLDQVRSLFPKGLNERISISTAHRFKGLEKPTVIVMDAVARSYPLIHPDWVFSRVLGDSPEKIAQEERRLLYVALTRAIDKLVIITDGQSRSPFLDELQSVVLLQEIDWRDYPPVRSLSSRLVAKVGNQEHLGGAPTIAIKDQLSAAGYLWQHAGWMAWAKSFPAEGFQIERLQAEVWAAAADGIDVRIYDESDELVGRFLIDHGQWVTVVDLLSSARAAVQDD
jgi:DNA helicase-4